jgi:hypothetical protein
VRPDEQRALEELAADLQLRDPELARALSAPPPHGAPGVGGRRPRWLAVSAIWLLGIAFGATLLGLGLAHRVELTTIVGAIITAAVAGVGVLVALHQRLGGPG